MIPAHVKALLDAVYGARWGEAWIEWGSFPQPQDFDRQGWGRADKVTPPDDRAVFWSAGLLKPGTGRANRNVERIMVFVLDDVGLAAKSKIDPMGPEMFMPPPTIKIESSPGNWQWQWGITDGIDEAEMAALRAGFPFKSDATAPSNLIRLPMGVSGKPGVVHTVGHEPLGPVYLKDDFVRLCGGFKVTIAAVQQSKAALEAPSLGHVEAALKALPNDGKAVYCKEHREWIKLGHALYGATGGLGFDLWDEWNAAQHQGRDVGFVWDSLHGTTTGWTSLAWIAREQGSGFDEALGALAPGAFDDEDGPVDNGDNDPGLPRALQLKYAREIARRWGGGMRYVLDRKGWAEFDGTVWRQYSPGIKLAGQYAMQMAERAPPKGKGDHDVTTLSFLDGVEGLCRQIPELQCSIADFDADPMLLGTPGGVVDLRTGVLRAGTAADMVSKSTVCAPADTVDCKRWLEFIDEITQKDGESIAFLQQFAGYCLTGSTIEEKLLFLFGPGGNGKSKFADMLAWIMGKYFVKPAPDMFIKKAHGMGHTSKLAMLAGARLCTISEVPAGAQWDEGLLKDVTGGGAITAGFKHRDEFTFEPQFKLLAYGNHQPTFPGGIDDAIRRRFMMMEFRFKAAPPDLELMGKLQKEGRGVLRWMIEGCLAWQKTGLMKPAKVEAATDAMFAEQDLMGRWIAARVEKVKGSMVGATDLFNDWREWCNERGEHEQVGTATAFGTELVMRRGFIKARSNSSRGYQDIKLKAKAPHVFDD